MKILKKGFWFFVFVFLCIFNNGSSNSILFIIEDYNQGKYSQIIENKELVFEGKDDRLIYNLILIKSSEITSNDIPQVVYENLASIEKPLKDYLLLELAKHYFKTNNFKKAENMIEMVNFSQLKNQNLHYESLRLKAQIYNKLNLFDKESQIWNFIQKKEGFSILNKKNALYNEAVALKNVGLEEKAKSLFEKIAFETEQNPFGSSAFKEILRLKSSLIDTMTNEKKKELAKKFLNSGRSKDALVILNSIEEKERDALLFANALYRSRENQTLFSFIDSTLSPNKDFSSDDLQVVLKGLWACLRTDDSTRANKYFTLLSQQGEKDSSSLIEANYAFGCFNFSQGEFKQSIPYFKNVISDEKNKFYYNALFKMAISEFLTGIKEKSTIEKLVSKNNPFQERVLFFCKNYLKDGCEITNTKLNLYSVIYDKNFSKKIKVLANMGRENSFKGKFNKNSLVYKLYKSGFSLYALNELDKEKVVSKEDRFTKTLLFSQGNHHCKELKNLNIELIFSYPLPFKDEISNAALKYGVEKSLMYAICRNESRFDPYAYSNTGAIGLFQIMPETAKALLKREVTEEELFVPEFNAEVAALYLKKLKDLFPQIAMVVSSYNAGEEVVQRWKNNFTEDETLFILMIPYFETQDYTEKVLFDKMIYDELLTE